MTSRRRFIQTLAALPPALSLRPAPAAAADADPSRVALVVGNSAYAAAPLVNPANDARAIAALFTQAGFSVESHLDATRAGMIGAIERFGAMARRPDTRQVVFYYAGHGAQLDWRNYLLPVDARVETAAHIKERCVDLGLLLGQFRAIRDKTFIVILDACRNNPFGAAFLPEQKGLSQFDAPVGSLLAYATSPGNVASDGDGRNGLYTEHLVRELSRRDARLEDALKRVRLNVRLASHGAQIPWETTSLEGDVFIFHDDRRRLSEAELERQLEADLAEWTRIKSSKRVEDWVGYLRGYPNGRFAEIAQMRLARLLAEDEERMAQARRQEEERQRRERDEVERARQRIPPDPRPGATPPAAAGPAPATTPGGAARIDIRAGVPLPPFFAASANPFSAGRYPLARTFTVGDVATVRKSDLLTGVEERTFQQRVTRVDRDEDRVEYNNGEFITDLMGNPIRNGQVEFDTPVQFAPAELQIGRKWTAAFRRTFNGRISNAYYDLHVAARETLDVPAGRFDCFRIEGEGWNLTQGARLEIRIWMVPGLIVNIRRDWLTRNRMGQFTNTERHELVSLRQHTIGA